MLEKLEELPELDEEAAKKKELSLVASKRQKKV